MNLYEPLIKKIKRKRRWVLALTIVAAVLVLLFTSSHETEVMGETVISYEGLHPAVTVVLLLVCWFVGMVAYAAVLLPLQTSMDQECDPEKQLILNMHLNKQKNIDHIYAGDYLYLGNYAQAMQHACNMMRSPNEEMVLAGLFIQARCDFLTENYEALKLTSANYERALLTSQRLKPKVKAVYHKINNILYLMRAVADGDLESVNRLRVTVESWNNSKATEGFVNYVKGVAAFCVSDREEAIYRFKTVKEACAKTVLARLSAWYLSRMNEGESVPVKEEAPAFHPAAFAYETSVPQKEEKRKLYGGLRAISILLFVLSICTIWGALIGVAALSAVNGMFVENMWMFFVFLPVPIASVVFGFYLRKKGFKYKKNVIAGFIMVGVLSLYGSFSFIFADIYSHSDEPIRNAEELLAIDIPDHVQINTQDYTKGTQSFPRGYIYYISDIYFDDDAVEEFEKGLAKDAKWISDVPTEMVGITSYFFDYYPSDYCIIYNKDTGEFNKLPSESGTYVFINLLYDMEDNVMTLVEYEIAYSK